jgi:hypothetical protein
VCPWNADHTDHSAFLVQRADGVIAAGCKHNSCQGKAWRDLRALYEPERQKAQKIPDKAADLHLVQPSAPIEQVPDLSRLEKALSGKDLTQLFTVVPALAQLPRIIYMQQKQRIKETFGKEINLNDLDASVSEARRAEEGEGGKENQAEVLVTLAEQHATFFADPGGICYARVPVQGHIETHPIHERGGLFKLWLLTCYRDAYRSIPNDAALASAMQMLTANALFGKAEAQKVYVRVGWRDGRCQ